MCSILYFLVFYVIIIDLYVNIYFVLKEGIVILKYDMFSLVN